jgi:hypothetical protein
MTVLDQRNFRPVVKSVTLLAFTANTGCKHSSLNESSTPSQPERNDGIIAKERSVGRLDADTRNADIIALAHELA